jgi:hypothetical protein
MCDKKSDTPNSDGLSDEEQVPARLRPLGVGERRALKLAEACKQIDLSANDPAVDNPASAVSWDDARQLRGCFVQWLVSESALCSNLPARRLNFIGAKIIDVLDLSFRTISTYLFFKQCSIAAGIKITGSRLVGLEFKHVCVGRIDGWAAVMEGSLLLERVHVSGTSMTPYASEPLSGVHLSGRARSLLYVDRVRGAARGRGDLCCDAAIELEVVGRGRNRAPFRADRASKVGRHWWRAAKRKRHG